MVVRTGAWHPGATPRAAAKLTLRLTNVVAITVDAVAARLRHAHATVTSDGPLVLTVARRAGRSVRFDVPAGTTTLSW